jgi:hypothetical protein
VRAAAAGAAATAAKPQQPPPSRGGARLPPAALWSGAPGASHAPPGRRLRPCRAAAGGDSDSNAPWWTVRACLWQQPHCHTDADHATIRRLPCVDQSLAELHVLTFNPGEEDEGIYTVSSRDGASACVRQLA